MHLLFPTPGVGRNGTCGIERGALTSDLLVVAYDGLATAGQARDKLFERLLDALAHCPDAAKPPGQWREPGRTDLTAEVPGGRLEAYAAGLLEASA